MNLFKKIGLLVLSVFTFFKCSNNQNQELQIKDADGNVYNTVTIGNQTWMLENLKTTSFNDGTPITAHINGTSWSSLNNQQPLYKWADTSDLSNIIDEELPFDYYGAMYNHWAIESGKLAPNGWRIPTQQDFKELEEYLLNNGYANEIVSALKSHSGWNASSGNGTNAIGFNSLPNGYVNIFGTPTLAEGICTWATTDINSDLPLGSRTRVLVQLFKNENILFSDNSISIGSGIRCIKK